MSPPRVCAIIGGARGIGAATAHALACRGDAVLVVDRAADDPHLPYSLATKDDLDCTVRSARAAAPDPALVAGVIADATDEAAMRTVLTNLAERHGGLDAVIVTAGVIAGGVPLWEMPAGELHAVLDVDLAAVIAIARAAIPIMLERPAPRHGRFVAVASTAASRGLPMLTAYGAAKAGVVGSSGGWPPSCAAPASRRTPSARAPPTHRSLRRPRGCTDCAAPRTSPPSNRSSG